MGSLYESARGRGWSLRGTLFAATMAWLPLTCFVGPQTAFAQSEDAQAPVDARAPIEGALGLMARYAAAFAGSSDRRLKPELGGFIRWGPVTLTGAGGFTTQRLDDVPRGLAADLASGRSWRVSLAGRLDRGRSDSSSDQLRGTGDIKSTMRVRLGARWHPHPGWSVVGGSNVDVLARVGGAILDVGVGREWVLDADTRLSIGVGMTAGSRSYMQAWYGITTEQSSSSGYPIYRARAGLRDASMGVTLRHEFRAERLAAFASVGVSRQLGPAAASPLTTQVQGSSLTLGLARRF